MNPLDTNALLSFIVDAHKATNKSTPKHLMKDHDGSTTLIFQKGNWRLHDNYFGGEPFGGREIVFLDDKPVWIMVYYGQVHIQTIEIDKVYTFLRKALALVSPDNPFRGPHVFGESNYIYNNLSEGSIENFSGGEIVYQNNEEIYRAAYMGGLIQQRD